MSVRSTSSLRAPSKALLCLGGLGSVGSLLSLWVSELQDNTHLWLLGRSGRGSWDPLSVGQCLVSLARSDVSVMEETKFVVEASQRLMTLRVCLPFMVYILFIYLTSQQKHQT